jgi:hypothetical protein
MEVGEHVGPLFCARILLPAMARRSPARWPTLTKALNGDQAPLTVTIMSVTKPAVSPASTLQYSSAVRPERSATAVSWMTT